MSYDNKKDGNLNSIVKVITSDSHIWNKEEFIFELISATQKGNVTLDLLYEGPDCQSAGIDQILDQVSTLLQVPRSTYLIKTSNQISSSAYPEIRTVFVELDQAKSLATTNHPVPSTLKNRFGIFIGRSNWHRLGLASYLHTQYQDQTCMTFHYDPSIEYHQNNFGLEEFVQRNWTHHDQVCEFLKHVPITHDKQSYPILWNETAFDLRKQYQDLFVEIVCETYFSGRTFFITEKTLRCIINRRPFLIQGPKYYLKNLQKLGFKTFSHWWDEGYDLDPADARYDTLCNNIDWIAQQSHDTIHRWYNEMQPVLEHNVKCLSQLTSTQILTTEFAYD
jgi:hypothetical protein